MQEFIRQKCNISNIFTKDTICSNSSDLQQTVEIKNECTQVDVINSTNNVNNSNEVQINVDIKKLQFNDVFKSSATNCCQQQVFSFYPFRHFVETFNRVLIENKMLFALICFVVNLYIPTILNVIYVWDPGFQNVH